MLFSRFGKPQTPASGSETPFTSDEPNVIVKESKTAYTGPASFYPNSTVLVFAFVRSVTGDNLDTYFTRLLFNVSL